MSNKVSQEEYNKWVHKTFYVLQNDRNVNYTRNLNSCAMVDLEAKRQSFIPVTVRDMALWNAL